MKKGKQHTTPKIKVCGMKHEDNILAVSALQLDYMGFIFYEKSPRNFDAEIPALPETLKKTGVFVDASLDFILEKVQKYGFQAVQLHGNESAEFCATLKNGFVEITRTETGSSIEIFKVFGIKDSFDFDILAPYEGIADFFLFDTKGKAKGGNGYTFDWSVLKDYNSTTPIILSGGIGVEELDQIKEILKTTLPIHALDLNSKFEQEPGLKIIEQLKIFVEAVTTKAKL